MTASDLGTDPSVYPVVGNDVGESINGPVSESRVAADEVGAVIDTDAMSPANTIAPTHDAHPVKGTGLIKTITPPSWIQPGMKITFIPSAAWTTDATGNIAKGSTAVANKALTLFWNGTKFYPDYT